MTFDLAKILESKRGFRERLASRPIAEKLAMLDAMRARHLAIQGWKSPQRLESKSTNGDPSISGGDSR